MFLQKETTNTGGLRHVQYDTNADNLIDVSATLNGTLVCHHCLQCGSLPSVTGNMEDSQRSEQKDCFHHRPCDVTVRKAVFQVGEELSHQ